jgi:hypothetical protein
MGRRSKNGKMEGNTKIEPPDTSENGLKYFYWGILFLIILFVAFIRIRLISIPLERDEGEFAYIGQLILQGIPPYLNSYDQKLPGIYGAYAIIMYVFGQSVEGIHLGFLVINAATIIMVFVLTRHLYDSYAGIITSASFGILSVSPSVLGTSAHATHFVLLPALGGTFLMLKAIDSGRLKHLFWSGMLLGISFVIKQHGVFVVIFAFLYLLFDLRRVRNIPFRPLLKHCSLFLFGTVIPFAFAVGILSLAGVFEKFWFWTFLYPFEYGSQIPRSLALEVFLNHTVDVIGKFYLLWGIGGLGLTALWWDRTARTRTPFAVGFLAFSLMAVCPGFYFRPHYFVLILPAVAVLIGIGISSLKRLFSRIQPKFHIIPTILFLVAFFYGMIQYGSFFFELTPFQACRAMYGPNPFPESIPIAEYIKAHSKEQDKIVVLGSEPQIYFYSKRHSATGYFYVYHLMEDQEYALKMQKEMAEEIERAKPKYLIFVNIYTSWLANVGSERYILGWLQVYLEKKFSLVGVVDILSKDKTEYRWDSEAANYDPRSPYFLCIYKNNTTGG